MNFKERKYSLQPNTIQARLLSARKANSPFTPKGKHKKIKKSSSRKSLVLDRGEISDEKNDINLTAETPKNEKMLPDIHKPMSVDFSLRSGSLSPKNPPNDVRNIKSLHIGYRK